MIVYFDFLGERVPCEIDPFLETLIGGTLEPGETIQEFLNKAAIGELFRLFEQ